MLKTSHTQQNRLLVNISRVTLINRSWAYRVDRSVRRETDTNNGYIRTRTNVRNFSFVFAAIFNYECECECNCLHSYIIRIIRCQHRGVPDLYASLNNLTRLIVSVLEEYRRTPNKSRPRLKSLSTAPPEGSTAK